VLAVALGAALDLIEREPERRMEVHRKAAFTRERLAEEGIGASGASPIVPIIAGSNEAAIDLEAGLFAAGFDVRAIRPPTVAIGTARMRVTVRYPLADSDLTRFEREVARLVHLRAA